MTLKSHFKQSLAALLTALSLVSPAPTAQGAHIAKTLSINEGMSQNTVKTILRDSRGFLWLGTKYGLNRYDFDYIKNYYFSTDSTSITDNDVWLLFEDAKGRVMVCARRGVSYYDYSTDRFTPVTLPGGRSLNVRSYLDEGETILLGGAGCLYRYDSEDQTVKEIATPGGSSVFYSHILPWGLGKYLLVTRWDGIYVFDSASGQATKAPFTDSREISASLIDDEGNLWIAPYGEGMRCYDRHGHLLHTVLPSKHGMYNDIVLDMLDKGAEIWFATDGAGIGIIDKETLSVRQLFNDVHIANAVKTLYVDACDNLYAGTVRDGVAMIHPTAMRTYLHAQPGGEDLIVTSITKDDGKVYYGCVGAGVVLYNPKTDAYESIPSTAGLKVTCVAPLDETTMILSTFDKGLFMYDKRTRTISPARGMYEKIHNENAKKALAFELWRLSPQKLAILTNTIYLCDIHGDKYTEVKVNIPGVNPGRVFPFHSRGDTLLLSCTNAILRLDAASQKIEPLYKLPLSESIVDATRDRNGNIYFATVNSVNVYNEKTGEYSQLSDIPKQISSLAIDGNSLWMGADNTVYHRDLTTGQTVAFNQFDGVTPNEFVNRAAHIDSDVVVIGGVNGLLRVDKAEFAKMKDDYDSVHAIHLSGLSIDGVSAYKDVEDDVVSVPYNHASIELSVIEMESNNMRSKRFRFYVDGGGQQRVYDTNNRHLQLGMLATGKTYTVSVSCSNPSGGWSAPVKVLTIKVESPWWRTWWAAMLCIAIIALGVFLFMRHRRSEIEKSRQAKERHDLEKEVGFLVNINQELRTPLSLIYGPLRLLNKRLTESKADPATIGELSKITRQAEKMRDVINMSMEMWRSGAVHSSPEMAHHDLNELLREGVAEFKGAADMKGVKFELQLDTHVESACYDNGRMTIVLNNMIINALKAVPTPPAITVSSHKDEVTTSFSVSHEVTGMTQQDIAGLFTQYSPEDTAHFGTGLGLAYAKLLVEIQGASIRAFLTNDDNSQVIVVQVDIPNVRQSEPLPEPSPAPEPEQTKEPEPSLHNIDDVDTSSMSIVVAEKDSGIASFVVGELERHFGTVLVCPDEREALIKIRNVQPDMVITSERAICREVKKSAELRHIPVVLLTSEKTEELTELAYRTGADGYLSKPFDMDALLSRIANLLTSRSILKERYQHSTPKPAKGKTHNNSDETFLLKINKIINENIQSPEFSVNTIVEKMLMSRSTVYTRFRDLTGQTLGNYVADFRLQRAKDMLSDMSLTINEVSDSLGFSSQRYFSTFFKSKTGMSPSQYRSSLQNK